MKIYLAKLVYRIFCGKGQHKPQFDEQLRLVCADDEFHAFQKARLFGEREQDRQASSTVTWKFVDVIELQPLGEQTDGAELYSCIREQEDGQAFEKAVRRQASLLHDSILNKDIFLP